MEQERLLTREFLSLCIITFLALCNIAVFYTFHHYLLELGFDGREAGFLIGLYSFTAMLCYLFISSYIELSNARICMVSGIVIIACCGVSYFFAQTFFPLALIRIVSGIGLFLTMSSSMVVLVSIIPPAKTGVAFSLYSVAMLLPYSIMPAFSEFLSSYIDSPPVIYMSTAILLVPAAAVTWVMIKRIEVRLRGMAAHKKQARGKKNGRANLFRREVLSILLTNCIYFLLFSSLFYLFKGYGIEKGLANPGLFFSILTGVMVSLRLFGSAIFDACAKVTLVTGALLITGLAYGLLAFSSEPWQIFTLAVLFGLGMGLCIPPLNALMFHTTLPQYRGYNANMMMLSMHFGSFSGPFVGAWVIEAGGYKMLFLWATALTLTAATLLLKINPGSRKGDKGTC